MEEVEDDKGKDDERCKVCSELCLQDDHALQCDMCDLWHHIDCENVSKAAYRVFSNNYLWFCDDCRVAFKVQKESSPIPSITTLQCYECKEDLIVTSATYKCIVEASPLGGRWHCPQCLCSTSLKRTTDEDSNKNVTPEHLLTNFNSFKQDLYKDLKVIIPELIRTEVNKKGRNMSDPPQSSIKHSIIFQPKESNERYSKETFAEMTKKNLPDRLKNLPVQRTVLTKQGKGFMVFPDQKTRDLAVKALESDCSVTVQNSEKRSILPKIKIVGIPTDNFDRNA